jgi:F0F1-type ATP synthase membrane subunit b/b'
VLQYRENVPKINALFQELRQKEFAAANAANAETQKILEDFKQKVQADKAKNQEGATKVEAELRESARRLEQAKQDLHSIVEEAQKQAEQGQKNQDHLKKLSRETQEL